MSEPVLVAEVAVAAPLEKPLSYLVPPELVSRAVEGMRLQVPLGRRLVIGFLLKVRQSADGGEGLKPIREVLDEEPLFPSHMASFFRWISEYYCHPPGETIRTAVPAGLSGKGRQAAVLHETFYRPIDRSDRPTGSKQRAILDFLREKGETPLSILRERFDAPTTVLHRLRELDFVESRQQERVRDPFLDRPVPSDDLRDPTDDQANALAAISEGLESESFSPFLLHGVTGSGKTEVYLRSIARCLEMGRTALVLVPEIALTPQLVDRFRARFSGQANLAVLHSGLSDGERYDAWRSIARGDVEIVIGARSAIFAPLSNPGIIVVDEEHEGSYKQGEGLRYNARDLALLRGKMEGAAVVLGSATPSLATYYRARNGTTGYLGLSGRVRSRPMPKVELVDLTASEHGEVLSEPLAEALRQTFADGEQALLLLNRRGFAPFLLCEDCGETFRCPNCEITLTYHQGQRLMRCHYCDFSLRPPEICPECQGLNLLPQGAGTERLEEDLAELLPGARIARMDRDTTTRKGAHQKLVDRMMAGEIDVLVGTQMVAKGHDFPGVTLVGVVNADSGLNFPDFRSAERTFSLLTQVAGRAGRGDKPGRVQIQTYSPEHYALTCVVEHDYPTFYEQEIAFRSELGYPPFGFLANLVFSGNDAEAVLAAAEPVAARLQTFSEVDVLGPTPCPLSRLRGKTRIQVLLKSPGRAALRSVLVEAQRLRRQVGSGVSLMIDVDPVDML
ncbi:MAG: primosomal protein N' [Desulfuromonadales bacterium]